MWKNIQCNQYCGGMKGVLRQHLAAMSCSLSIAATGVAFVWFAPLMLTIISEDSPIPMRTTESSWLVSFIEIGSLFTVIPCGIIADYVGRKYPVLFTGPVVALTYIVTAYTRSLSVLFVLRFIHGLCMALAYTCGPIYIAEISEPQRRGSTSSHLQTFWYVGGLFAYCVGPYVNYTTYALTSVTLPVLLTITFAIMPESPYYLLMKGRKEEAKKSLSWLRGGAPISEEFKSIEDTIQREYHDKGSWKELFQTKKNRKAFLIVQVCSITKYMGGISAFINYASQTLGESTTKFLDHNQLTIAIGITLTIFTAGSSMITDRIGRRPMLIYSCLMCCFFNIVIGWYFFLDFQTGFDVTPYIWVLYLFIFAFLVASSVGLSPLMQTIQAEYFSTRTRGIGGGITLAIASAVTFLSIKQYQFVQDTYGVYLNYWSYSLVSLLGTLCMYAFLPETAGRSLGQIQKDMK